MKITIEPYSGGVFTASNDAEHISEVIDLFKGLLVQSGYHPKTVDEYFSSEENCWFPDKISELNDEIVEQIITESKQNHKYNSQTT